MDPLSTPPTQKVGEGGRVGSLLLSSPPPLPPDPNSPTTVRVVTGDVVIGTGLGGDGSSEFLLLVRPPPL